MEKYLITYRILNIWETVVALVIVPLLRLLTKQQLITKLTLRDNCID